MQTISLPARLDQLNFVHAKLEEIMSGKLEPLLFKTQLLVEELLVNICQYAYDGKSGEAVFRCGEVNFDGKPCVMFSLVDHGKPFDPFSAEVAKPDIDADIDDRQIGGLGIFMVAEVSTHYTYARIDDTNVVTVYLAYETDE